MSGRPAGNGWNSPVNNAEWGTDYLNRTATARSNMLDNRPEETKYIYTDFDVQGKQLTGRNNCAITFPKGQVPRRGYSPLSGSTARPKPPSTRVGNQATSRR